MIASLTTDVQDCPVGRMADGTYPESRWVGLSQSESTFPPGMQSEQ